MRSVFKMKELSLFFAAVIVDIILIQLFRHFTPVIVWLRLSFIFLVLSISIYLFYCIIRPENPVKTGAFYSVLSFFIALSESYLIHVVIEHGHYKALYLLPSGFALILPVFMAIVYRKFHPAKIE